MIRYILTAYYRWKYRKQDPGVCCCGDDYEAHGQHTGHGFVSMVDYAVACAVDRLTTWAGWADRTIYLPKRPPDVVIGSPDNPYLLRWWLIPRNPLFNVYLHCFCRSDDDRALHDHPWLFNLSVLLRGQYREWVPAQKHGYPKGGHAATHWQPMGETGWRPLAHGIDRKAGAIKWRWGRAPHRIELTGMRCWTLFITGPRVRQWGFYCPQGWKHWRDFTAPGKPGEIGPGCDE